MPAELGQRQQPERGAPNLLEASGGLIIVPVSHLRKAVQSRALLSNTAARLILPEELLGLQPVERGCNPHRVSRQAFGRIPSLFVMLHSAKQVRKSANNALWDFSHSRRTWTTKVRGPPRSASTVKSSRRRPSAARCGSWRFSAAGPTFFGQHNAPHSAQWHRLPQALRTDLDRFVGSGRNCRRVSDASYTGCELLFWSRGSVHLLGRHRGQLVQGGPHGAYQTLHAVPRRRADGIDVFRRHALDTTGALASFMRSQARLLAGFNTNVNDCLEAPPFSVGTAVAGAKFATAGGAASQMP